VAQRSENNAAELEFLKMQVQKARQMVRQSELKVEAIEATIHEIEEFQPKIIHRPVRHDPTTEDSFRLFAEDMVLKAV
jgi:hypothetical protein